MMAMITMTVMMMMVVMVMTIVMVMMMVMPHSRLGTMLNIYSQANVDKVLSAVFDSLYTFSNCRLWGPGLR